MHLLVRLVYDSALPRIFHAMSYSVFFSFRDHICLLSSVAFRNLGLIKDCLWLANLSLNSVSVSPTYDSVFFFLVRSLSFSRVVTVAWYTISCSLQLPFRGQLALLRQLQTFFASVSDFLSCALFATHTTKHSSKNLTPRQRKSVTVTSIISLPLYQ